MMWFYERESPKDADWMANSVIWVYTVYPDLSVHKFGTIVVSADENVSMARWKAFLTLDHGLLVWNRM